MTDHLAVLEELARKWRDHGERQYQLADATGLSEGEMGWHSGRSEQADDCADELAILIAELGQEVGAVAPVSFAVELADGTLGALGWIDYAKFEHVKNMGTLANGARYVFAYRTSPAHTSEARDAGVTDELVEMVAEEFHDWHDGSNLHDAISIALRKGLAAMRQEGGPDA